MSKVPSLGIHIDLDEEQIVELERLSAMGYSHEHMAMFFKLDKTLFCRAAADPDSMVNYHIRRGQITSIAREQMAVLGKAEKGDVAAVQQLEKIRRNRGFEISKLDIFGAFDSREAFHKLEDFIQSGGASDLSKEESIYLEALTLMSSMDRKYGRRNTIAFFTKPPFNLKHSRAAEMYDEAITLFFTDRNVEKKAMRHKLADQIAEAALVVKNMAQSSKDFEVYGDLVMKEAKLRELDKADPIPVAKELYLRPVRYYSLDPEVVGITGINRNDVAAQIDALDIPEREHLRLKRDALIEPIIIADILDELEEESKTRK